MTITGPSGTETLTGGGVERRPRRGLNVALAVVVVAAAATGIVIKHNEANGRANRLDAPTLRVLSQLAAQTGPSYNYPGPATLGLDVYRKGDLPLTRLRVLHLAIDGGALGPARAIVINHFIGTGPGPLINEVAPFTVDESELRINVTFAHGAVCGRPVPGNPPLVMDVGLPSGRTTEVHVPVDRLSDPTTNATAPPLVTWPVALSHATCLMARTPR